MFNTQASAAPRVSPPSNAARFRDTETGDYIVCHDSPVYHLHDHPRHDWSDGVSLCRQVDSWRFGGRYRSGRRKPIRSNCPPGGRRLCEVCASVAASREESPTQAQRLVSWLWTVAAGMPTDRLTWSADYAPKRLARHISRLELRRRERAGRLSA